jgi:hypothetical protein
VTGKARKGKKYRVKSKFSARGTKTVARAVKVKVN